MEASEQQQQQQTLTKTLKTILSESWRIIKSQPRLFLALSLLFFVPLPAAVAIFQYLLPGNASPAKTTYIFLALNSLLALIFSSCATISITFAAFHSYKNSETTDLKTALKSISASFFPYLATHLLYMFIQCTAIFVLVFVCAISVEIIGLLLGFGTQNPGSPHLAYYSLLAIVPAMYIKINWSLAYPVVVFDSKWGFEALRTSKGLIKGKRRTLLSLVVFLEIFTLIISMSNRVASSSLVDTRTNNTSWIYFVDIAVIFFNVGFGLLIQLYDIVATTVLYAICKASNTHPGDEYSSLLVNDEKVSLIV